MDILYQSFIDNYTSYNWNSPFTLVFALLVVFLLLRKWGMFITLATTIVLGIGGANFMIMNVAKAQQVITVPMVIYIIGGTILGVITLYTYIKYTLF